MDHHGGQFERDGRTTTQVSVDGFDLCDNVASSEALTAQTQNLNETQSLPVSQNDEEEPFGLSQTASLNNNGKDDQEEHAGRMRDEDEEEDTDEVMEEEESEASSSLICCQSPDIPMTDSSYSETGSLLETPYPFSPGTSPEPTSPIVPGVSSETLHPISLLELNQGDAELPGSTICTHGPTFSSGPADPRMMTPDGPSGPVCVTGQDKLVKDFSAEQVTSSTETVINCGSSSSDSGPISSAAMAFMLNELTRTDASSAASATTKPLSFATGPHATDTELSSTAWHLPSNQEQNTSVPATTCSSFSPCTKGRVLSPALLKSLEQLAQRDDDTHLPHYFHQIAEACVLQKDYQRAVWFIQLERLYHQRVLDNLNALQKQWESHCEGPASDLATQHLDTLKHICRTHTRPRTRDAEGAVLDVLRPKSEGGDLQPSCFSIHQVDGGMEQRAEDSSSVRHSRNLLETLNSPEKDRQDPSEELEGRDICYESKLMEKQAHGSEVKGGVECTIPVVGNGLHPSSAGDMDRSSSAEQQGEDLGPAQEREAKGEEVESDIEEAKEALAMEDEGADDEEEEEEEEDSRFCLTVETLVCGAELEEQQLQTDDLIQEKLHDESQQCPNTQQHSSTAWLHEETLPPEESHRKQQLQHAERKKEEEEEEEEEDYEADQADLIREAPSLDHMARLITVEEMSPASGLVSILKKQSVYGDVVSSVPNPENPTAKRRVRFRVPDESYDHEVGSGDSCLLLFLLCLVTVVISIGGTALYCAFGDAQSSVCQDFSRNADFYMDQIHRGISQLQLWFAPGS